MSMDEETKFNEKYADSNDNINYEPYRADYRQPDWKDSRKLYKSSKPRDYGTERHSDKEVYFSRDLAEKEWESLFAKTWHFVGI